MRKALAIATAVVALGLSACGTSDKTDAAPSGATTPPRSQGVQSATPKPQAPQGSDIPCPTQADFERAIDDYNTQIAPALDESPKPVKVTLHSAVECRGTRAAAKAAVDVPGQDVEGEGTVTIQVLYWRYAELEEAGQPRTDADKKWTLLHWSKKFLPGDSVCDTGPLIEWLKKQGSCLS